MSNSSSKHHKEVFLSTLQEILHKEAVTTQEALRLALQKQGIRANQALISRALHKLGAIKVKEGQHMVYRLPGELIAVTTRNSLQQLILSITSNESLIVIRTAPGSAQLVGRLLDQQKSIGILGTVSGDDTIFIAPEKAGEIKKVLANISRLLLG